ncbi:MAG: hypothetical protein AAF604_14205 [Acidobacteriota bacterium]
MERYEAGDFEGFLAATGAALELAPDHLRLRYNLACGQSLTGDAAAAGKTLRELAAGGAHFDLDSEKDFDPIRATRSFRRARRAMAKLEKPVGRASREATLRAAGALPEGIAYDETSRTLFVGTVRGRTLYRISDGRSEAWLGPKEGLQGVFGMAVDSPRRRLWLCSAAVPEMVGYDADQANRAELLAVGLDDGVIDRRLLLPEAARDCNDLIVADDGGVFVATNRGGMVLRLAAGGESFETLLSAGTLRAPGGLALSADQRSLWVADWSRGLWRIEIESGEAHPILGEDRSILRGVDGLVRDGDRLIAVQNGFRPHRVISWKLQGDRIVDEKVLLRHHPDFDEPTLALRTGRRLLIIANSQWETLATGGEGRDPVVLSLALR